MVDIAEDIESLSAFKRDTANMVKKLKRTKRPVVLTVNGRAAVVVQDAASYQALLDIKDKYETMVAIEEGLEDARQGKHRPVKEVFAAIRKELGLPRRAGAKSPR
jgi:prevent-host-death family protein